MEASLVRKVLAEIDNSRTNHRKRLYISKKSKKITRFLSFSHCDLFKNMSVVPTTVLYASPDKVKLLPV